MSELLEKIRKKEATVGIIGLGYVGLPLLIRFGQAGFPLIGFDIDTRKINALVGGESYIRHIPVEPLNDLFARKRMDVTTNFDRLKEADCILICVPTPLTEKMEPDLRFVVNTTETVARYLRPGQLVILESTTYPGTTRDVMLPILEKKGLKEGRHFFLSFYR